MSQRTFPTSIKGLTYTVVKRPAYATILQSAGSGQEVRIPQRANPIWEWTFIWDYIYNNWPGPNNTMAYAPWTDLQTFIGFFMARLGQASSYLYTDPDDNAVGPGLLSTSWQRLTPYAINTLGNILDSNNHWQQVVVPGTSGSSVPGSWNSSGGTTTDGGVTWLDMGHYAFGFPNPQALLQVVDDGVGNYYALLQRNMGGQSGWEDITDLNPGPSGLSLYAAGALLSPGESPGNYVVGGPGLALPGVASSGLWALIINALWPANYQPLSSIIVDTNGNLQQAGGGFGYTGSTVPVWNQTVGGTTADNGVTWTNLGYNPGPGVMSAAFSYYFRVRTSEDSQDYEKFMAQLWTVGGSGSKNGSGMFKVISAFPSQQPAARFFGYPSLTGITTGGSVAWPQTSILVILGDLAIGMWIKIPTGAVAYPTTGATFLIGAWQNITGGENIAYSLTIAGAAGAWNIYYEHLSGTDSFTFPCSIPNDTWVYVGITRASVPKTVTCYVGDGATLRSCGSFTYTDAPTAGTGAYACNVALNYLGSPRGPVTIQEHYVASRQWSASDHISAMKGSPPSYELQLACSMGNTPEIDYSPNAFSGAVVGTLLVGGHD
jgi:hypothetical protein